MSDTTQPSDFVALKFRWRCTVATESESINLYLRPSQEDHITLTWNEHWHLYESDVVQVSCDCYSDAYLKIDGIQHICDAFLVVPTSFEVTLYLEEDEQELPINKDESQLDFGDWQYGNVTSGESNTYSSKSQVIPSPLPKEMGFVPNTSLSSSVRRSLSLDYKDNWNLKYEASRSYFAEGQRSSDALQALLESREREISSLKDEVHQLQLTVSQLMKENKNVFVKGTSFANVNEQDESDIKMKHYFEKSSVNSKDLFSINHVADEMKTLRQELHNAHQQNDKLMKEIAILKLERCNFDKLHIVQDEHGSKLNCSSEKGTQGHHGQEEHSLSSEVLPKRSKAAFPASLRDTDNFSGSHEGSLTSVLDKMGTGVQTDVTALFGDPTLCTEAEELGIHKGKLGRRRRATKTKSRSTTIPGHRHSSDTDELLEEAEIFLKGSDLLSTTQDDYAENQICSSFSAGSNKFIFHISTTPKKTMLPPVPFLPNTPDKLKPGVFIKYIGSGGRMSQGRVIFPGALPTQSGTVIAIECLDSTYRHSNSSREHSIETHVPFKKVVLAWNEE